MNIDSIADVKLVGRAVKEWLRDDDEKRKQAVDALYDVVIDNADPAMKDIAFRALLQADVVNIKRQELELKKQALDDARRLRLLELIKHLPPGVLDKIAARDTAPSSDGRQGEGCDTQSESESI